MTNQAASVDLMRSFGFKLNVNFAKWKNSQTRSEDAWSRSCRPTEEFTSNTWLGQRILRCSQQIRDYAILSFLLCQESKNFFTFFLRLRLSESVSVKC